MPYFFALKDSHAYNHTVIAPSNTRAGFKSTACFIALLVHMNMP